MKTAIKGHNDFFKVFGKEEEGITLPASNTLEEIVIALAEHYQDTTKAGHGIFFDFKATPELEKPVLDYLIDGFGWTLEKPFFIRKPKKQNAYLWKPFGRCTADIC